MRDEPPWFSPTHGGAERRKRPRERLFDFVRADDVPMACDLFDHAEFGFEVQFLERGELVSAQGGYRTREEAVAWANGERKTLEG